MSDPDDRLGPGTSWPQLQLIRLSKLEPYSQGRRGGEVHEVAHCQKSIMCVYVCVYTVHVVLLEFIPYKLWFTIKFNTYKLMLDQRVQEYKSMQFGFGGLPDMLNHWSHQQMFKNFSKGFDNLDLGYLSRLSGGFSEALTHYKRRFHWIATELPVFRFLQTLAPENFVFGFWSLLLAHCHMGNPQFCKQCSDPASPSLLLLSLLLPSSFFSSLVFSAAQPVAVLWSNCPVAGLVGVIGVRRQRGRFNFLRQTFSGALWDTLCQLRALLCLGCEN